MMRYKEGSMHSILVFEKGEAGLVYGGSLANLGTALCIRFGRLETASSQCIPATRI
jgi:hypothetical protein